MMRTLYLVIFTLCCVIAHATDFVGYWKGEVMNLPIVFHITNHNGQYSATLSSPSQGAADIACDRTVISADSISIEISSLGMRYDGVMQADGKAITGTYIQGMALKLTLTPATAQDAAIVRPQDPKPPFFYNTREVTFANGDITLAATLTTPSPIFSPTSPAVVLVTGSGAQNRDEEIMGHRPFAVIADYLTRAGIAVLRYDDRGIGGSSQGKTTDTTLDFASDAMAAVNFLKSQPDINPAAVGVLGHSEGGSIALITAASMPDDIAFAISLAGVAVKGRDAMIEQNRMIARASSQELTADKAQAVNDIFWAIDTITDKDALGIKIREIMTTAATHSSSQIDQSVAIMTSPWYSAFIRLDMAQYLPLVKCPVLALNGQWDIQVGAEQNLNAIKQAIPSAQTIEYPRLNHMFQESASLSQSLSYGNIQQTISPIVLSDIAKFIITPAKNIKSAR